jgi:hypothetical protein
MRVVPEATRRVNYLVTLTVLNKVTDHGTIRSARVDLVAKLFRPGFEKAIAEIKQPATEDWPMKSNCYGRCIVQTMATKIKEPTKTLAVLILRAIAKHRRR